LEIAQKVTQGAAPGSETVLDAITLETLSANMPSHTLSKDALLNIKFIDLMVNLGLLVSKGEARRLIRNGGVYLNNARVDDENGAVTEDHLIEGRLILLAVGKKKKVLIRVEEKS